MRTFRRVGVVLTTFGLIVLSQFPAYAADGYQETVPGLPAAASHGCDPDLLAQIRRQEKDDGNPLTPIPPWGQACFFASGDDFWVVDLEADGDSVAIQWKLTDGSRSGLIRDKLGKGVNSMLNKDFPEGAILKWRMGRCNQTASNDCRQASDYKDWGVNNTGTPEAYCTPVDGSGGEAFCAWP